MINRPRNQNPRYAVALPRNVVFLVSSIAYSILLFQQIVPVLLELPKVIYLQDMRNYGSV